MAETSKGKKFVRVKGYVGEAYPNAATSPWSATARAPSATPAAPRRGAVEDCRREEL
jgi:hypothetical protein